MSQFLTSAQALLREPRLRELLRWCLPALLIGLVLRVVLTVHLPVAYYHDDAPDFLTTPDRLITDHKLELHEKKTFLVPILFTLPFALPIPAMKSIPFAQHLMGLGLIVLIGALCRLWLTNTWKVFIIPLTVLAAVNPFYLWYEHTLMAETTFVFCTVLVALAGTLYAQQPKMPRFVGLCLALVLEAGGRPEGKLLFGFGLLLVVLMNWGRLRTAWVQPVALLVVAIVTHFCTKTSQAGLLLYTSVARITPSELSCAPGFDPFIHDIRADLQHRWAERPSFPRVRDRRAIAGAVDNYLKHRGDNARRHEDVNAFCLRLAKETCLRNLPALPGLALAKFRAVANESPAARLDNAMLFGKQREAFLDSLARVIRLSHGLLGSTVHDADEMQHWVDTHYGEVPWFNTLNDRWLAAVNAARLPDERYRFPEAPLGVMVVPGVPLYFIAALLGVLAVMIPRGELQRFHVAWGLTLLGFFFTIMLTANVRPRFRFVFEPFWFIYVVLLAECAWLSVKKLVRR